jgi:hypothetical protein
MFNDLFHLIALLDHDFSGENGERVHAYTCRRCAIAMRLSSLKDQIRRILHDMEFSVGDPVEEKGTDLKASAKSRVSTDR